MCHCRFQLECSVFLAHILCICPHFTVALYEYFDKLFPGKIHSASVVLNLPDLEAVSARCHRVCERLEKSIAYYEAKGERPTHYVGVPRITVLGLQSPPLSCFCCKSAEVLRFDGDDMQTLQRPQRGAHVDSISYYVQDMAATSRALIKMQKRKTQIAESGNRVNRADKWIDNVMAVASEYAQQIMADSEEDNALKAYSNSFRRRGRTGSAIPQVENMRSIYGSFGYQGEPLSTPPLGDHCNVQWNVADETDRRSHLLSPEDSFVSSFIDMIQGVYSIGCVEAHMSCLLTTSHSIAKSARIPQVSALLQSAILKLPERRTTIGR